MPRNPSVSAPRDKGTQGSQKEVIQEDEDQEPREQSPTYNDERRSIDGVVEKNSFGIILVLVICVLVGAVGLPTNSGRCSSSFETANFDAIRNHDIFSQDHKLALKLQIEHSKEKARIYHFVGKSASNIRELAGLYANAAGTELHVLPHTGQMETFKKVISKCDCPVFFYLVPSDTSLDTSFAHHLKYLTETPSIQNRCLTFIFGSEVDVSGKLTSPDPNDHDVLDVTTVAVATMAFGHHRVHRITIPVAVP
eukprot:TRINITY_DN21627_c0_g1_i1.p1 TRINITY_DN21627_c0_g1~~TRINITY_DN21627_c0_g1_i1.p1  ORF type:complete len:252 (+),score=36.52 TRINITY_DN21627_c0_g1_i1:52-807(+)